MSDESEPPASLDTTTTQPPADVRRDFWVLVAVGNAALLSLALGLLLLGFTDRGLVGGGLVGLGAGLTIYGVNRYRRRKA